MQQFKPPKDNEKYRWTHHAVRKLHFYGLTPSRVLRVVRAPERMEEGIVEGTLAAMSPYGRSREARQTNGKSYRGEIWVMWRDESEASPSSSRKVIITAWRYPGVSPVREKVPIPAGLISELEAEGELA